MFLFFRQIKKYMDTKKTKVTNKKAKISVQHLDFQTPIRKLLEAMGEDADSPKLIRTPMRFDEAIKSILSGYDRSFEEEVWDFEPNLPYRDIIMLKNINYFSMCRHHLLPFFGYAHVAYIPNGKKCLGISKLARAVDIYAKRFTDQESISTQVAEALTTHGDAKGVAILMEGRHLCNVARGIEKTVSVMTTCSFYGSFKNNPGLQQQFMDLVREREHI
jgi:GTP cyclohydrolase I